MHCLGVIMQACLQEDGGFRELNLDCMGEGGNTHCNLILGKRPSASYMGIRGEKGGGG